MESSSELFIYFTHLRGAIKKEEISPVIQEEEEEEEEEERFVRNSHDDKLRNIKRFSMLYSLI